MKSLQATDKQIFKYVSLESERQEDTLMLIPSGVFWGTNSALILFLILFPD